MELVGCFGPMKPQRIWTSKEVPGWPLLKFQVMELNRELRCLACCLFYKFIWSIYFSNLAIIAGK